MIMTASLTSISLLLSILAQAPATAPPPMPPAAGSPPSPSPTPSPTWPPDGGFALELGTGGLSGTIGGALGLGWGSRRLQIGVAVDVTHADLSSNDPSDDNLGHAMTTAFAVGPWFRWAMGQTRDGRVDAIGAIDFQYTRVSVDNRNGNTGIGNSGAANGIVLRAGPGVRFWATPWLALSYTTQVSFSQLSGPLVAFGGASNITQGGGLLDINFEDTQFALVGRLSVLAVF